MKKFVIISSLIVIIVGCILISQIPKQKIQKTYLTGQRASSVVLAELELDMDELFNQKFYYENLAVKIFQDLKAKNGLAPACKGAGVDAIKWCVNEAMKYYEKESITVKEKRGTTTTERIIGKPITVIDNKFTKD